MSKISLGSQGTIRTIHKETPILPTFNGDSFVITVAKPSIFHNLTDTVEKVASVISSLPSTISQHSEIHIPSFLSSHKSSQDTEETISFLDNQNHLLFDYKQQSTPQESVFTYHSEETMRTGGRRVTRRLLTA